MGAINSYGWRRFNRAMVILGIIGLAGGAQAQTGYPPATVGQSQLPMQAIPSAPNAPDQPVTDPNAPPPATNPEGTMPAGGQPPATATAAGPLGPCIAQRHEGQPGSTDATYHEDDLIAGAEGVFGKGAKGLAKMIERILRKQGEPDAYIAGHEASAAFIVGVRYGSGQLCHKVEGQRPVYWTGPSIGFDVGANASKVFVLIYNLYDTQDIYKRYAEVEGHAYYIGGLSATYLRKGHVVLIPVRLGVGLRLGVNGGYMKFREKNHWSPF